MKCIEEVIKQASPCKNNECRYFIEYENDLNCTFIAINKHKTLTFEEISVRLNLTPARIKQLQDDALNRMKKRSITLKVYQ